MLGLFLGAGASYEIGMPLVTEFSNEIRQNVLRRLETRLFNFDKIPNLKTTLETLLRDEKYNYEEVLGELEKNYYKEREYQQEVWGVINQFIECIQLLLLEDQKNTLDFFHRKIKDYSGITALAKNNSPLHVFSLNHDIVFEEICSYHKIPLKDGFYEQETKYKNIANFKIIRKQDIEKSNFDFYKKDEIGVNLIKLHGSFDVFAANDKEVFLKSYGDGHKFGSHYQEIEKIENYNLSVANADQSRMVNELLIHDDENELQFLRRSLLSGGHKFKDKHHQIIPIEFLRLFKNKLKNKLNEINNLVVIGYSFGDSHINDIIYEWLKSENRKLTIYDPFRKEHPECFDGYYEKIEIINAGLTDYFVSCVTPITPSEKHDIYLNCQIREKLKTKRLLMESLENKKAAV